MAGTSSIQILVVEDYEPFRRFLLSKLQNLCEPQDIREVSDGFEAVQQAQRLQPDLILLDIGLPTLNGFEVASQIRKLSPNSKILFVSQESSADVVQKVLDLGAYGYVVKADAGNELLAAVTVALRGERFIGSRFAGHDFTGIANLPAGNTLSSNVVDTSSSPTALGREEVVHRHEAHFYSDDESFLNGMTQFVGTALKAGSAVIVLATASHRESLLSCLQANDIETTAAIGQRRYIPLDSAEILSRFMVDDVLDPIRFYKLAADLIDTASRGAGGEPTRVVACGELAPLLLKQGKPELAIQLEQLWDQLVKRHSLDTLCPYSQASFDIEPDKSVFQRICDQHSVVHSV